MQFPMVMGGVVMVVNLPGIGPGQLKLTNPILADIYLGKINKWDDPAIKGLNPGLKLPSQAITVVHRSDGSGTTFIFYQLSFHGLSGMEAESRRQYLGAVAGRHRRQRQ